MGNDSGRANVGVANPYVLAELRAGHPIDWEAVDAKETLSRLLDVRYEHLFDPKYGSPLYASVPLDFSRNRCGHGADETVEIKRAFDTPVARKLVNEGLVSTSVLAGDVVSPRMLAAQATEQLRADLEKVAPPCRQEADAARSQRAAELAVASRLEALAQSRLVHTGKPLSVLGERIVIIPPDWWRLIQSDLSFGLPGEYFVDAPTITAPVQGALGDCWLIAAMASVAWTNPELIAERIRREDPTGDVDAGHADFRFDLTDVLSINLGFITVHIPYTFPVWVGEEVPQSNGSYLYARSSVAGETWPAVLEKAVAVWRSGGNADYPDSADYQHLSGGDAAWACHILTGRDQWYHWADADDTWSTIVGKCSGNRARVPLTAWTWGSSDDSPNKVDYAGANLVANHAYSILGTWETNDRQYVVLRNPWGTHEGTLNTHSGTWGTSESWGTANLALPGNGVFALEVHTFREYFMGFGGV
jgi:hypothetical protein